MTDSACGFEEVLTCPQASQVVLVVKNPPANAGDIREPGLIPGWGRSPGREHGNPLQVFLPGESHRQRSLEGYGLWDHRVGHDWSNLECTHATCPHLWNEKAGLEDIWGPFQGHPFYHSLSISRWHLFQSALVQLRFLEIEAAKEII